MEKIIVAAPLTKQCAAKLKAGDSVLISGTIYTARDAAHKRMADKGKIPFDIKNAVVYYTGPTPPKPGQIIGSCGPTTSGRMDEYTPALIEQGMTGMIGKGERSAAVVNAMKEHTSVYFGAIGGAGALISKCVQSCDVIAYDDLGAEAVRKLTVKDFPAVVLIDSKGNKITGGD